MFFFCFFLGFICDLVPLLRDDDDDDDDNNDDFRNVYRALWFFIKFYGYFA